MTPDPYEEILYPGFPFAQTHPDRLFTVAALYGVAAARPETCRLLEIGCGDGVNLVAMAEGLPGMRAVGIDRAAYPLERGRSIAAEIGLDNVELRAVDLLEADGDLGEFDYVVAHGVFSWVPDPVREALLALIARLLAPAGVAFVSYNALPGGHVRRAARDLLRWHARDAVEPGRRVQRAREAIALAQRFGNRTDPFGIALENEITRLAALPASSLLHDDLGHDWEPYMLADFVARARAHGLAYLADAELGELHDERYPAGVDDAIREAEPDDPVAREQYGDMLAGRPFRQTLLVGPDAAPSPDPVVSGLGALHLSARRAPDPLAGEYASPADAALAVLAARYPRGATLGELAEETGTSADLLGAGLLGAFRAGLLELEARPPRHASVLPERPSVTHLARVMARDGVHVPTLDHGVFRSDDPVTRRLITLMDGTRDREALVEGLLDSVGTELVLEVEGGGPPGREDLRGPFTHQTEINLAAFLKERLIVQDAA